MWLSGHPLFWFAYDGMQTPQELFSHIRQVLAELRQNIDSGALRDYAAVRHDHRCALWSHGMISHPTK